jgi:GH24 family phage-related lysozyme (muramidase)
VHKFLSIFFAKLVNSVDLSSSVCFQWCLGVWTICWGHWTISRLFFLIA